MVVLQDNKRANNLSNDILVLNRVNIQNILNSPLKATQRIKVLYIVNTFIFIVNKK